MNLRDDHATHLSAFRIPPELLEEAGVCSVTNAEVRELLGVNGSRNGDNLGGIFFPYLSPQTGHRTAARVRLDVRLSDGGKYYAERESQNLYFPPGAAAYLEDTSITGTIVEAEKSTLALTAFAERTGQKMLVIGIGGCWGFRKTIGKRPLPNGGTEAEKGPSPDFDIVKWTGRSVVVMLDSNAATNSSVRAARSALIKELATRGAKVLVAELPATVNGLDDLLKDAGDEAMQTVLDDATPIGKPILTDRANAVRFAREHSGSVKWCSEIGAWFAWDSKRWRRDDLGEVMRRAEETADGILDDTKGVTDEEERKRRFKWAVHSSSKSGIDAMISLARWDLSVEVRKFDDVFDTDPLLLNCPNGILNLRTGVLGPHRREAFLTKLAGVDYDPTMKTTRFSNYLTETFMDSGERKANNNAATEREADGKLLDYVQRLTGYFSTGLTGEQSLYFLTGPAETGKSTFVKIVRRTLGEYATSLPSGALLAKKFNDDDEHAVADLPGVRFASAVETATGRRLNEQKIKQITGQDYVRARHLYENSFEFRPQAKLVIATNHLPAVKDTDDAIWRRLKVVEFKRIIKNKVKDLDESLIEKEGPGILAWMVEGCKLYLTDGLQEPERVTSAVKSYRTKEDIVQQWVNESCDCNLGTDSEYKTRLSELYANYSDWSKRGNMYPMTRNSFGRELGRLKFQSDPTGGDAYRLGIQLKGI